MFMIFVVMFKGYDGFSTLLVGNADRTNGRAYATVLRPSIVVCDVMYCG